jgi:hypothetical protein
VKQAPNFVLGPSPSSTYHNTYASELSVPAVLLDSLFEHPAM